MDETTKLLVIIFAVFVGICVIAGYFGVKKNKKLIAEGKIIKRNASFYKNKQFFKAFINDQQAFFSALTASAQNTGVCSLSGDYNSTMVYRGRSWTARLDRLQSDDGSLMFAYALTQFDEYRGMPKHMVDFNIMLTAIEKVFVQFDPNTQITEQAINFKTKHSLF